MQLFGRREIRPLRQLVWTMCSIGLLLGAATVAMHLRFDLEFLFVPLLLSSLLLPAAILLDLTTSVHCVFLYEDGRVEFRSRVRTTRVSAKDIRAMEYVRGQEGAPALCRVVWDGGSIVVSNDLEGLDELEGNLRRHNRWFVGRFQDEHFRH